MPIMNSYELTIVLDGKASSAKKKAVMASLEKLVKNFEGKLGKLTDWGVKELMYKIGKSETGAYLHYEVELPGKGAKDIAVKLNQEDGVIRYLLIRAEK